MRRPGAAPTTPFSKLRPFVVPILFVGLVIVVLRAGLDLEALREDLAAGRPDQALSRLATAPADDLPPSLRDVSWWPAAAREVALAALEELPDEELLEAPDRPTFVYPLDDFLEAPERIVLREPPGQPLVLELRQVTVDLLAGAVPWPAGATELAMPARLFRGARYTLALRDPSGAYVALAAFRPLSEDDTHAAGIALATAAGFAGDSVDPLGVDPLGAGPTGAGGTGAGGIGTDRTDGARLLMALTARQLGLTDAAATLFRELADRPAYAAVAGQLWALTLAEQGLDRTARDVLRGVR